MIRSVNTCTNCQNLVNNFKCEKHNKDVDLNNVCDAHVTKSALSRESSCVNCSLYLLSTCKFPESAAEGMLCFSWKA